MQGSERLELKWDEKTQSLTGWTLLNGRRVFVNIPRQMIHSKLTIYNDAIEWEIERFKADIVQRLAPWLLQQAAE